MVMLVSLSAGLGSISSGFVSDVRLGETDTSLYFPMFPLMTTTLLISAATNISVVLIADISTGALFAKFISSGAEILLFLSQNEKKSSLMSETKVICYFF